MDEEFFYETNGFKIEKNFENTVKKFISKISPEDQFYYDLFEYNGLLYVIPIRKAIVEKDIGLLSGDRANKHMDETLIEDCPIFGTNIKVALNDVIVDGFFDVEYFIKLVVGILYLTKEKLFIGHEVIDQEEYEFESEVYYNYERRDEILADLRKGARHMPTHSFLNTHQAAFNYLRKYYNLVSEYTTMMLMEIFTSANHPFSEEIFLHYFGYIDGFEIKTERNINKFERINFEPVFYLLDDAIPADHEGYYGDEKFISENIRDGKIKTLDRFDENFDVAYIYIFFDKLPSKYSFHVLGERSGELETKWKGNFASKSEEEIFDDFGLHDTHETVFTLSEKVRKIGDNFFMESSIQTLKMPLQIRKIGNNFLRGCKMIKSLDVSHVEEDIGVMFAADSSIEKINFRPSNLIRISNGFLSSTNIIHINLQFPRLRIIDMSFMLDCPLLETAKLDFPDLTEIGYLFMANCKKLEIFDLTTSSLFEKVESNFLRNCPLLTIVNISNWPKKIDDNFLSGCPSLIHVSDAKTQIKYIGKNFLAGAEKLESFKIHKKPEKIDSGFMGLCPENVVQDVFSAEKKFYSFGEDDPFLTAEKKFYSLGDDDPFFIPAQNKATLGNFYPSSPQKQNRASRNNDDDDDQQEVAPSRKLYYDDQNEKKAAPIYVGKSQAAKYSTGPPPMNTTRPSQPVVRQTNTSNSRNFFQLSEEDKEFARRFFGK
jgi:hypothetical protein